MKLITTICNISVRDKSFDKTSHTNNRIIYRVLKLKYDLLQKDSHRNM